MICELFLFQRKDTNNTKLEHLSILPSALCDKTLRKDYLRNLKYSDSSCFLFFRKSDTISIPITEKVIPFPPKPNTN